MYSPSLACCAASKKLCTYLLASFLCVECVAILLFDFERSPGRILDWSMIEPVPRDFPVIRHVITCSCLAIISYESSIIRLSLVHNQHGLQANPTVFPSFGHRYRGRLLAFLA